jgi:hypothetical protein
MREANEEVKMPMVEQVTSTHTPRTTMIFRAWEGYEYTPGDLVNLREAIAETSLGSGAEYRVFILVHVKNRGRKIFSNQRNHYRVLQELVSAESRAGPFCLRNSPRKLVSRDQVSQHHIPNHAASATVRAFLPRV